MVIRKANEKDIDRIEEIYNRILEKQDQGEMLIGWIRGVYPTRKTAEDALEAGERISIRFVEKSGCVGA